MKFRISVFRNAKGVNPTNTISLAEFIRSVRSEEWATQIQQVRGYLALNERELANEEKKKLPGITPAGVFLKRAKENLHSYSRIVVGDADSLGEAHASELLERAKTDEFCLGA